MHHAKFCYFIIFFIMGFHFSANSSHSSNEPFWRLLHAPQDSITGCGVIEENIQESGEVKITVSVGDWASVWSFSKLSLDLEDLHFVKNDGPLVKTEILSIDDESGFEYNVETTKLSYSSISDLLTFEKVISESHTKSYGVPVSDIRATKLIIRYRDSQPTDVRVFESNMLKQTFSKKSLRNIKRRHLNYKEVLHCQLRV